MFLHLSVILFTGKGVVMFSHLSVILFTGGGGCCLSRGVSVQVGSVSRGGSLSRGLCPEPGLCPAGGGGLCPGGFCSGGLSRRRPHTVEERAVRILLEYIIVL